MEKYKVLSVEIDGKVYDLRETQAIKPVEKQTVAETIVTNKKCASCHETKPLDHFTKDKNSPDGIQRRCRECKNDIQRVYNKKRRAHEKRKQQMRDYCARKKKEKEFAGISHSVTSPQTVKPEIGFMDGTKEDAIPVTPLSNVDEKAVDSVIGDPEKRKRFHW